MSKVNSYNKKILIAGLILAYLLTSCRGGEGNSLKEETIYMEEMNREWLAPDTLDGNFLMTDDNGISQSFTMNTNSNEFGKGWSSWLGINTLTTYTEEYYQAYTSSFGLRFSLSMRANSPPHGDNISLSLGDIGFGYDFDFQTVHHLDTPFGYKNMLITDKGYETFNDGEIESTIHILGSLDTYYTSYNDVMHFTLNDFNDLWNDYTVTDIYYARGIGLVKYTLAGGISAERSE